MSRLQLLLRIAVAVLALAAVGAFACCFQVAANEAAVLVRFGSPARTLAEPGLYAKWPWPIDTVARFDSRLAFHDTRIAEALTRDRRNVVVPVWVAWHIAEPLRFLQALGGPGAVPARLDSLVTSARNTLLGQLDFADLVGAGTGGGKLADFERQLAAEVRGPALSAYGLAIEEIGVRRIALPEANTLFVFERMKAERGQYAARFRAEGRREAEELRARTDAERTVALANARQYADETRGRAEAEAARIYAEAHSQDPEFYAFVRELEALRKVAKENTSLVLDADAVPFRALQRAADRAGSPSLP